MALKGLLSTYSAPDRARTPLQRGGTQVHVAPGALYHAESSQTWEAGVSTSILQAWNLRRGRDEDWSKVAQLKVGSAQIRCLRCVCRQQPFPLHILESYSRKRDATAVCRQRCWVLRARPPALRQGVPRTLRGCYEKTRRGHSAHLLHYLWFTLNSNHMEQGGSQRPGTRNSTREPFTSPEGPSSLILCPYPSHLRGQLEGLRSQSGTRPGVGGSPLSSAPWDF